MKAVWMTERGEDLLRTIYTQETMTAVADKLEFVGLITGTEQLEPMKQSLKDVEYIFSTWGMLPLTSAQIQEYFPALKAVFYGAGSVQQFARPFLEEGVRVFSAASANAVPVAEYTVAQILLALKGFYQAARLYKEGKRAEGAAYSKSMTGIYDAVVGIIGAGMIGRMVIQKLKDYQVRVLCFDPFLPEETARELGVTKVPLETLFEESDVISNHLANNPQTVGMLNGDLFRRMKKKAALINTGRGAQVVEEDLVQALTEEPERTAILDVTWPEPVVEGHPFYELPNVVLTPHIAGSLGQEVARMGEYQVQEFLRYIEGRPLSMEVTADMLETMA